MTSQAENYLNCRQHLRDNIPMLLEYFVKYYGEERRQEIEDKFNHALFLAYRNPNTTELFLGQLSKEISDEIIDKYLKETSTIFTKEELFEHDFKFASIQPIAKYESFFEDYQLGPEGRIEQFKKDALENLKRYLPDLTEEDYETMIRTQKILPEYENIPPFIKDNISYFIDMENADKRMKRFYSECKELLHKINPNITIDNFSYFLDNDQIQELNHLVEQRQQMIQEYQNRMAAYESYQQETANDASSKEQLENDYYIRFIEENIDLLSPEDIEDFGKNKQNPTRVMFNQRIKAIFGYSLLYNHLFNSFSEEANEALEKGKPAWKVDSIKNDRIKYSKEMGLDFGDDYEAYASSEEAKGIWPSVERVAKFQESRNRLLNEFNIAYYSSRPSHQEARQEIENLHLLDNDDGFNARIYVAKSSVTFVNPNLVQTQEGYRLYPLVVINCDQNTGHTDHDIVHELNHVFELSLKSVDENSYEVLCGWDVLDASINTKEAKQVDTLATTREKRSYELFNEIVNELIAQEISEMIQNDQNFIFDTQETAVCKGTSSYENTFFLVKDFFHEFKKEILESRSNGNIQIIWDRVGKENFDNLNELFHIFFEHFDGFKYYGLIQSLKANEDNNETRIYRDLVAKRDAILDQMRKYSMTHDMDEQPELVEQEVKS